MTIDTYTWLYDSTHVIPWQKAHDSMAVRRLDNFTDSTVWQNMFSKINRRLLTNDTCMPNSQMIFLGIYCKQYFVPISVYTNTIIIMIIKQLAVQWNGYNSKSMGILDIHLSLLKHAYSNTFRIYNKKNENFQIKKSDIFHDFAQT